MASVFLALLLTCFLVGAMSASTKENSKCTVMYSRKARLYQILVSRLSQSFFLLAYNYFYRFLYLWEKFTLILFEVIAANLGVTVS